MMRPRALPRCSSSVVGFEREPRGIMKAERNRLKEETLENQGFRQTFKGWKMVGVMGFEPVGNPGYCVEGEPCGKRCSIPVVHSAWFLDLHRGSCRCREPYTCTLEGVNG